MKHRLTKSVRQLLKQFTTKQLVSASWWRQRKHQGSSESERCSVIHPVVGEIFPSGLTGVDIISVTGPVKGNICLPVSSTEESIHRFHPNLQENNWNFIAFHLIDLKSIKTNFQIFRSLSAPSGLCGCGTVLYCGTSPLPRPRKYRHRNLSHLYDLISLTESAAHIETIYMDEQDDRQEGNIVTAWWTVPLRRRQTALLIRKKRKRVVKAFNVERQERGSTADIGIVALGWVLFGQFSGSTWRQQARRPALQEWRLHPASWPLVYFEFSARPGCHSHPVTCSRDGMTRLALQNCLWVQDTTEPTSIVNVRRAFCTADWETLKHMEKYKIQT